MRLIIHNFLQSNRLSHLPCFAKTHGFSHYPLFSKLILTICLFLGISENVVYDWQSLRRGVVSNPHKSLSILELYYFQNFKHWHVIIPEYNAPLILFLEILLKLATWGWVYMDVICVLLCRALWEKLWIISDKLSWSPFGKERSAGGNQISSTILGVPTTNAEQSGVYKEEYTVVAELVEQVQKYISPMIVVCYVGNMYILIVMMFNWIGPFSTEGVSREKTIHVCFAFFQFLFRVTIITYFAGEVHHMCLEIRRRIQMCPNSLYSISVRKNTWYEFLHRNS